VEVSAGIVQLSEQYNDPGLQTHAAQYQQATYGQQVLNSGTLVPFGAAFITETTIFREFGPLAGETMRLGYTVAPKFGSTLSRQTVDADVRRYQRLGTTGLLALRLRGFKSMGDAPDFLYFGGNSELRGYDYLEFAGQNTIFANAELRFPIIEAALTPIGVLGGVRGVFFAGIGGAWFNGQPSADTCTSSGYKFATSAAKLDANNLPIPTYGNPQTISGFRLKDGRASYGLGLETFALGFPIHFDWSWRTLFNKSWEDVVFAGQNGCSASGAGCSDAWRKPRFAVWIGYDF
jgi:hypothetical protein